MEGLAALNGLARCVVLHIVADWKLRGGYLLEIPDDDAKEKKRNERSKKRHETRATYSSHGLRSNCHCAEFERLLPVA